MEELKKEITGIIDKVGGDLKELAKKHGAWIIVALLVIYCWKKIH